MSLLANLDKYKSFFSIKKRFFLINILILTSLSFVVLQNINEIRYKTINTEDGKVLILDRFTSIIKVPK